MAVLEQRQESARGNRKERQAIKLRERQKQGTIQAAKKAFRKATKEAKKVARESAAAEMQGLDESTMWAFVKSLGGGGKSAPSQTIRQLISDKKFVVKRDAIEKVLPRVQPARQEEEEKEERKGRRSSNARDRGGAFADAG